ncbi:hypothetical protein NECAME_15798 [Necator americanus]|uniref:Uncharacterized protein n=1 Tax=Necator americanus TaxID=51031 RepID=W2SFV0_NECAM|nr:hypothetical protein NECAME_15798 [Necator americanus]ETN68470.1 hypothetical protein NECAME_15798 [Necator americanus]
MRLKHVDFFEVPAFSPSIHHRSRTTPDPRIIKPPESLVVIGEYDEEEPLDNQSTSASESTEESGEQPKTTTQ